MDARQRIVLRRDVAHLVFFDTAKLICPYQFGIMIILPMAVSRQVYSRNKLKYNIFYIIIL